ncbi:MAG: DUF4062 domain-containing protein [Flavipsychrobacter sp.]
MAKPRIFISSTCFDLNDARSELTDFLEKYNFEVLNSQLKNFGVSPKKHSHTACLDQVENADFFVVIVGKRRGGTFIGSEKSITNEEYNLAVKRGIPIIICVDKQVDNTMPLYKKNPSANFTGIVDDIRIFHFVEYIKSASEDNWVFQYENVNDIKDILKSQFSYYLLLFSKSLQKNILKDKKADSSKLTFVKFPTNLDNLKSKKFSQEEETAFRNGIKELHKTLSLILSSSGINSNKVEKLKTLWVIARHGQMNWDATGIEINNDIFKDYAWSTTKGRRVSTQLKPLGINFKYDFDDEEGKTTITLTFKNENEDCLTAYALHTIVTDLLKEHDEDEAFELFKKIDFRLYMS